MTSRTTDPRRPAPDTIQDHDPVNDPILQDPVLARALGSLAELPPSPDFTGRVLGAVDHRRRFALRRRRSRVRRAGYALAAALVAVVGGVAVLHRLAPQTFGTERIAGSDRSSGGPAFGAARVQNDVSVVANELADTLTLFMGTQSSGAFGLTTSGTDEALGVTSTSGIAIRTASGELIDLDEFLKLAPGLERKAGYAPGSLGRAVRALLSHPAAANQQPMPFTSIADPAAGATPAGVGGPAGSGLSGRVVIDLNDVLSRPAPAASSRRGP